ncbi:MAG: tyrosine-type recombinase/integrase [Bdellovibrionaceae bacterium]|nr:tyrosine-type recombinase/integrase [Pseudobdellovibrionaceae bacterium]
MTPKQAYAQIDNYLKYMENINSCSPHTQRAYKKDLDDFFEPVKTSKPHKNDLRSYFSAQLVSLGDLSLASRNRKVGTLKSFLNWMYETHLLDSPLSDLYHSPKVPRKIPHFISFDEVTSCLDFLSRRHSSKNSDEDLIFRQQRLLFLFLYGAGLRISEGCNLKITDINRFEKKILIRGKGAKERFVVCPDFVWTEWNSYEDYLKTFPKTSNVFFRLKKSRPEDLSISERTGYEWIRSIGQQAGLIQNLNPHALRHSFATHLLNSGANLRVIQNLLGHSTLSATEKYTHLNLSQLYQTLERSHPLGKLKKAR